MKNVEEIKTKINILKKSEWSDSEGYYKKDMLEGYIDKEELEAFKEGIIETINISSNKKEALALSMNKKVKKIYFYER